MSKERQKVLRVPRGSSYEARDPEAQRRLVGIYSHLLRLVMIMAGTETMNIVSIGSGKLWLERGLTRRFPTAKIYAGDIDFYALFEGNGTGTSHSTLRLVTFDANHPPFVCGVVHAIIINACVGEFGPNHEAIVSTLCNLSNYLKPDIGAMLIHTVPAHHPVSFKNHINGSDWIVEGLQRSGNFGWTGRLDTTPQPHYPTEMIAAYRDASAMTYLSDILKKLRFATCFFSIHPSNPLFSPIGLQTGVRWVYKPFQPSSAVDVNSLRFSITMEENPD